MALGLAFSIWYLVWVRTGGSGFLGITQLTFSIFGVAVSISYHLSIMTKKSAS
jgi:cation/acetate symporter